MTRHQRAKLVLALIDRPHSTTSLKAYVLPAVSVREIRTALAELIATRQVVTEASSPTRGISYVSYRWVADPSAQCSPPNEPPTRQARNIPIPKRPRHDLASRRLVILEPQVRFDEMSARLQTRAICREAKLVARRRRVMEVVA